ncbi:DNA-binding protein [Mycolicibacterium sp. CH28]|uniref:helix-turn-helix domain-containing protein n=1 Tax=Mycolicibacterium sp. CH28 TaxID=2512237 RepID=UPI0010818FE6|nr:helix-turn-helix domain-containing protein [Mycolicibacterium sp. CH28]TGD87972.1 DNA-binding protein [Mycolicibacterium sp. CH28]
MLTVKQAARDLGITTEALRKQVKAGIGPAHHRCGNRMLFTKADVLAYRSVAAQETG